MLVRTKKAQTITEYAILIGIVISAIAGMQVYVKRGLAARVKSGTDALTAPDATFTVGEYETSFASMSQYEPYYQESVGESFQEEVVQQHSGDGRVVEEIVSKISASAAGGYRGELAGSATQETRDAIWDDGDSE